jgi:hypothetical protein
LAPAVVSSYKGRSACPTFDYRGSAIPTDRPQPFMALPLFFIPFSHPSHFPPIPSPSFSFHPIGTNQPQPPQFGPNIGLGSQSPPNDWVEPPTPPLVLIRHPCRLRSPSEAGENPGPPGRRDLANTSPITFWPRGDKWSPVRVPSVFLRSFLPFILFLQLLIPFSSLLLSPYSCAFLSSFLSFSLNFPPSSQAFSPISRFPSEHWHNNPLRLIQSRRRKSLLPARQAQIRPIQLGKRKILLIQLG